MKKICLLLLFFAAIGLTLRAQDSKPPVRFAIVGLSHDHASGFIPRLTGRTDVELVGIIETNQDLIERYSRRFHLKPNLFYPSLDDLFAKTSIQAVATFTSVYEHQHVVEVCAAHHVDVMMEKALATNMKQACAIQAAAKRGGIQVFVNYETSWYPGTTAAYKMLHDEHQLGDIRKMVFHDGHRGPKEIGCSTNFLAWLTDPVLDGGGAINDFGCYGADIATWFFDGQKPISVFAVSQQLKPDIYPKVEDDATIILTYPHASVILQPSWNWPMNRKDMEVYCSQGQLLLPQGDMMTVQHLKEPQPTATEPLPLTGAYADPVSYFAAIVRKEIAPTGLASLDVNVTVVEILEAAHKSVKSGKAVKL